MNQFFQLIFMNDLIFLYDVNLKTEKIFPQSMKSKLIFLKRIPKLLLSSVYEKLIK